MRVQIDIEAAHKSLIYDAETGLFFRPQKPKWGWYAGGTHGNGYRLIQVNHRAVLAHRLAWAMHYGYTPPDFIDHINGDKSDNRICNLRLASNSQNRANSIKFKNNGMPKGVRFVKDENKFRSLIIKDGKKIDLGSHKSADLAAHAYNKAAIALFGEFARLNPIGSDK